MKILGFILTIFLGFVFPFWLGHGGHSWFWLLLIGVPIALISKPIVYYNLLLTEGQNKNYSGIAWMFVGNALIFAILGSIPYFVGMWFGR